MTGQDFLFSGIIIRDNYTFRCVRECRRIHYEFINNIDVGITVAANDSVTLLKTILTRGITAGQIQSINLGNPSKSVHFHCVASVFTVLQRYIWAISCQLSFMRVHATIRLEAFRLKTRTKGQMIVLIPDQQPIAKPIHCFINHSSKTFILKKKRVGCHHSSIRPC